MAAPQIDLREEVVSGDPSRQSRSLLAILGLLSAGREVGSYVAIICQAILGNANVTPATKCIAYDVVHAATPSDGDCARIAAAIAADLQSGTPPELRVKALAALSLLPAHHVLRLLGKGAVRARLEAALRSPVGAVRAASVEAVLDLAAADPVPAAAAEEEHEELSIGFTAAANGNGGEGGEERKGGVKGLLYCAVGVAGEGLTDDESAVVAAAARALAALLTAKKRLAPAAEAAAPGTEAAKAAAVRANLAEAAVLTIDATFGAALARFRALPAGLLPDIPPLVGAYLQAVQLRADQMPLDSLPGDAMAGRAHAFEEAAAFLGEMVRAGDPPAILAAAEGLFGLAQMDAASSTLQALFPSAIAAAVRASQAAGPHQRAVAQRAVLSLLLRHLEILPSVQRAGLFPFLPPMIAALPAGADRVNAFFLFWSAAAAHDWALPLPPPPRSRGQPAAAAPAPLQLQQLLLDPSIKECISGVASDTTGPPPHSRYRDPSFREELVGSLLYMLLTHPRPAAVTSANAVAAGSHAVAQASAAQAAAAAVDWLALAKLALMGTKPCLGWDRMAGVPTTGTTAAADMWLQLLLRCITLGRALRTNLLTADAADAAAAPATAPAGGAAPAQGESSVFAPLIRRARELDGELQGLLLQIAANWRALHPVARPRAVWLCACHVQLRSVVDAAWTGLADAVHGLLLEARVGEGAGVAAAGAAAAIAAGCLRVKEGGTTGGRHDAGVAAGAGEAEEVAVLSLERLARLVAANHTGKLQGQLAPVAGLLEKVAGARAGQGLAPGTAERLARIQALLKPVATVGKEARTGKTASTVSVVASMMPSPKRGAAAKTAAAAAAQQESEGPIIVELISSDDAASYPSTLPCARALFAAPESARYRKLLEQLQSAALAKSIAAAGGAAAVVATTSAAPSGGLPSLLELAEVLESGSTQGSTVAGTEVTGPASPVSLTLSHTVDPGAGTIRLRCVATNRTNQAIAGVAATLLLGGPIAGNRRPLTFRLATLPPRESTDWEVALRVSGFGWPLVQPALSLPVQVPMGLPALRCRPYAVSPLQLLAPAARALSPSEFYQRWQALPHRASVAAVTTQPGPLGVAKVLAAVEAAGLTCVMKAVVPVAGGVHAAFHGAAWSGEGISVVVTSPGESSGASGSGATKMRRLLLHFGSEASEVVAHVRGHEADLLVQLTGGAAVPGPGDGAAAGRGEDAAESGAAQAEPDRPSTTVSTFSFLRSIALQMDSSSGGNAEEDADAAEKAAAAKEETEALHSAALAHWRHVHSLRAGF